jgi:hypothetical protein
MYHLSNGQQCKDIASGVLEAMQLQVIKLCLGSLSFSDG